MKIYPNLSKLIYFSIIFLTYFVGKAQHNSPAHLGLMYPISTHGTKAAEYQNNFSLHLLSGISAGENGLAIYGLAGLIQGNGSGLQVAGLYNGMGGEFRGVQVAGLVNNVILSVYGIQVSGLVNISKGSNPVQVTGLVNKTDQVDGVQIAGLVNFSRKLNGIQVSGISNISQEVDGIQISGLFNKARKVDGSQIGGLINRAETVRGIQIAGLLNIADSSDYPIAIINLIKTGEKRIGIGTDENYSSLIRFRSGGNQLYGIIGLGTNLQTHDFKYGLEAGLGIKLLDSRRFRLDLEAVNLILTDFKRSEFSKSGIRLLPAIKFSERLELYAGPSINYMHTDPSQVDRWKGGIEIWDYSHYGNYHSILIGYNVGFQVKL